MFQSQGLQRYLRISAPFFIQHHKETKEVSGSELFATAAHPPRAPFRTTARSQREKAENGWEEQEEFATSWRQLWSLKSLADHRAIAENTGCLLNPAERPRAFRVRG